MKVSTWLKAHPRALRTVARDAPVEEALARLLEDPSLRDVYVADDDGCLLGHVSEHKIARHLLGHHRPVLTRRQIMQRVAGATAGELMNAHFPIARPDDELDEVLHRQLEHDVEDLPILEDDRPIGAVNLRQVLQALEEGRIDDDEDA